MTAHRMIAGLFGVSLLVTAMTMAAPPPAPSDGGLLAGPKVEREAEKADGGRMGKNGQREASRREESGAQQWLNALKETKLNAQQQMKVRAIMNEFEQEQRKYAESMSVEDKAAFRTVREARAAGKEVPPEMRQKMQKFESNRPKVEPYQERIWAELTLAQQKDFKARLEAMRERAAERKNERRGMEPNKAGPNPNEPGDPMMTDPKAERPGAGGPKSPQEIERRKNAEKQAGGKSERAAAERRMNFLKSRQAKQPGAEPRHSDGKPTDKDKDFKFEDRPEKKEKP